VWIRIILKKNENKTKERKIELVVIPHFNKYLNDYHRFAKENRAQKKSSLPLLNNLITKKKWAIDQVFIISLDGAIIGSENELNKII
jgi:hypothetical protein